MSADGSTYAWPTATGLCAQVGGSAPECVDMGFEPARGPAISRIGDVVAFTEVRFGSDSDVWVYEVAGGEAVNVTPDGYDGRASLADGPLDTAPSISWDGEQVAFVRAAAGAAGPEVWIVPTAGGEPRGVAVFPSTEVWGFSTHWLPGDEQVLVSVGSIDPGGMWLVGLDGSVTSVLGTDAERGSPIIVDVSSDGAMALVFYEQYVGFNAGEVSLPVIEVIDLRTGEQAPLVLADGLLPGSAAFTEDGTGVVFTWANDETDAGGVSIATLAASSEGLALEGIQEIADAESNPMLGDANASPFVVVPMTMSVTFDRITVPANPARLVTAEFP